MDIKELQSFQMGDAIKFHDQLNPKLWRNNQLRPEVKDQLETIAKDFLEELGINGLDVTDLTLSGSNAAYSYTPNSDLDLHILVDMSKYPDDDIYRELFNAKKTIYNDTHDIHIHGVPVELYVQDSREPVVSLGEYSLKNDKWLRIPTKRRANLDQTATKQKYEKLSRLVDVALKSKQYSKVKNVLQTIKRYRQAGLDKGGEFGPENLAYKALRSQGYITKLYDLKNNLHSEILTIETMYQDPSKIQEDANDEIHNYKKLDKILTKLCRMIVEGQLSNKDYGMVAACVLDPDNNIVAGLNSPGVGSKRLHAERVAIEKYEKKYGEVPEGSIVLTTLSPCNENHDETAAGRYGESCTDYLNSKGIEKVYCGYIDPTQDNDQRQFNIIETSDKNIRKECKRFADTFLEEDGTMQYASEKTPTVNPYAGVKDNQFRGSISETFDQPYPIKWEKTEFGDYDALVKLPDGTNLSMMFNDTGSGAWEIGFYRNNSLEVTGEGDAQRIFATVLAAIQKFIKKHKPNAIKFSASKEVEPGQNSESRTKLYNRLVQRYASGMGYNVEKVEYPEDTMYKLTRNEQKVTEASGYIPSEKEKNDPRFKTALTVDVHPDSIQKNAKAFYWKTTRAGIPPTAKANGKIS